MKKEEEGRGVERQGNIKKETRAVNHCCLE